MKSIKTVFIKAACMLAFVFVSNSFSLQQLKAQANYHAQADADIRYISAEDNLLVFEMRLQNLPAKGSNIRITDEDGNMIFEDRVTTTTCNVRYKIERNNVNKLTFEILGKNLRLNKSFSISSRTEEKIEVAKL